MMIFAATVTTGKCLIGFTSGSMNRFDVEPQEVGERRPHDADRALDDQRQPGLAGLEPQPLVDAVQPAVEDLEQVSRTARSST